MPAAAVRRLEAQSSSFPLLCNEVTLPQLINSPAAQRLEPAATGAVSRRRRCGGRHASIGSWKEAGKRRTDREASSSRRCAIIAPRFLSAALRTCGTWHKGSSHPSSCSGRPVLVSASTAGRCAAMLGRWHGRRAPAGRHQVGGSRAVEHAARHRERKLHVGSRSVSTARAPPRHLSAPGSCCAAAAGRRSGSRRCPAKRRRSACPAAPPRTAPRR